MGVQIEGGGTLGIYVPSYKRHDTTTTYKILEHCTYVVRKSEEALYRQIEGLNIWAVEDSLIDNMYKVVNFIHENAPEDIICTIDDDMAHLVYRLDTNETFDDPVVVTSEIERIGQIIYDLGIGYACVDSSIAPWNYNSEFEFKGTSGGLRWVNKNVFKSSFLEEIGYCCDIDVVLHELLVNRIILKPKYLCSHGGTDTNKGGNSGKKRADQLASVERMRQKWGKYYRFDEKSNKPYVMVKRT